MDRPEEPARQRAKRSVHRIVRENLIEEDDCERLLTLIDSPDLLTQGHRGICGLTCVVHTLLVHDVSKFADLVDAVFDDWDMTIGCIDIRGGQLMVKLRKQLQRKHESVPAGDYVSTRELLDTDVDFLLARSLGKLLKIASPQTFNDLLPLNLKFERLFLVRGRTIDLPIELKTTAEDLQLGRWGRGAPGFADDAGPLQAALVQACGWGMNLASMSLRAIKPGRWEVTWKERDYRRGLVLTAKPDGRLAVAVRVSGGIRAEGDLAMDGPALWTLMAQVFCSEAFLLLAINPEVITKVNEALTHPKSYAYGLVNGVINWWDAYDAAIAGKSPTDPAFTFDQPPQTKAHPASVPGEHWVVITGPIVVHGMYYVIPVWTWSRRFTVRVAYELMGSYFPQMVVGFLK